MNKIGMQMPADGGSFYSDPLDLKDHEKKYRAQAKPEHPDAQLLRDIDQVTLSEIQHAYTMGFRG